MATVAFAYGSLGDIIETIKFIAKIIHLVRGGGKPSDEWKETEKELRSLCSDLTHLITLQPAVSSPHHFISGRLREEGAHCLSIASKFHSKIAGSRSLFQRVLWATFEEKEVATFRRQIMERRVALSGMSEQINLALLRSFQDCVHEVDERVRLGKDRVQDDVTAVARQITDQERILSRGLNIIRETFVQVSDEIHLGNNQIQAGVSAVSRQLTDQEQALSGGIITHVDEVGNEVRLGNLHIQEGVGGISQTLKQSQISDLKKKLEEWLKCPTDMTEKQHQTQKLHYEGTGKWFLDSPEFGEWKDKPGFLWINGQSGTGKTVLSSTVIRTLSEDQQRFVQGTALAYFYFDFRDAQKQLVEIMLRTIIMQLSAQSSHPYAALDRKYRLLKGQTLPTYSILMDILETLLSDIGRTYIVLDALDECKDTDLPSLVHLISRLGNWTRSPLHMLFTGQDREIFTKAFEGISQVLLLFDTTQNDISLFVASELRSNPGLKHVAHRSEEVTRSVVEKSSGMFRLAACLLDELSRRKIDPDLHTILDNLPTDLFGIYGRFLGEIHQSDFVVVARVLRRLVFSAGPVTLSELTDALAFDFSDKQMFVFDPARRGKQAIEVCKVLQGLVTVNAPSTTWPLSYHLDIDEESDLGSEDGAHSQPIVILAHSSVADYIMSTEFRHQYKHDLTMGPSHTFLAQTCVAYLLHFADHPLGWTPTSEDYPLGSYAAQYWDFHLLRCDNHAGLLNLTMGVLDGASSQYRAMVFLRSGGVHEGMLPLALCAMIGYAEGVRFLLQNGADVNATSGHYESATSALKTASVNGHTGIVRLLLEKGAEVNAMCGHYGSALQAASTHGHTDIVLLLLEHGADVNAGGECASALQRAARGGMKTLSGSYS